MSFCLIVGLTVCYIASVIKINSLYIWVYLPWQCLCPPQTSGVTWSWAPPPQHCVWRVSSSSSTVSPEVYASDASRKTPYCSAISGYPEKLENAICNKFTKLRYLFPLIILLFFFDSKKICIYNSIMTVIHHLIG